MRKIITKDNTITFYNEEIGDVYHSESGAKQEAFEKFAKPALIPFMTNPPQIIEILDICFGLGYNSCAAIDFITRHMPDTKIIITGLENDEKILQKVNELNPEFENYEKIKQAVKVNYNAQLLKINIIQGDAISTIENVGQIDIVFHDPFSPKKQPSLWTEELFRKAYNKLRKGGILLTYSCAKKVRENLLKAGFRVEDGPCVGRRAPSTIAVKHNI
ncbi:MAG: tRNA (5-methylaminomethyl-2-thiouridine)(34)-methyltransferase MnmD [Nanobdellota archaeon]